MRSIFSAILVGLISALAACGGGASQGGGGNNGPTLSSIQVLGLNANIVAGQNQQLTAKASYSDGSTKDVTATATWSSSNTNVATVSSGGMLAAKANGQCSISAKIGAIGGSLGVTVDPALASIAITPANPSIAVLTKQQLIATGTYSDNSTQNLTTQVTWSSSNLSVATVGTSAPTMGLVAALTAGNTSVSATLGSVTGNTQVTVTAATVTQIQVTALSPTLAPGLSEQFTAVGTFSDGSTQDITNVVQWQSSNSNVASITVSGLGTGRTLGTVTISAILGGVTGSTSLTINAANVSSIAISPAGGSIAQGTQKTFTATGTYTDGSTHDLTRIVTWSSDNTAALTIGSSNGLARGVAPGQANVTATLGSLSVSVPFTITNATVVSIAVVLNPPSIPTGGRTVLSAVATFSDSSTQSIGTIATWSSDNTAVATIGTVSPNVGSAIGISAGTANISATFSYAGASATGSTQLTVSSATLASITLNPVKAFIAPGSSVGIAANGNFTDGSVEWINPLCTWTSSDKTIATVSPNGLVSGQSAGAVTITAQDGPISVTANVLVESASLSTVTVAPSTRSVPVGFRTGFAATGNFSNGDTQNLTDFVNWTSSQPSFATISNAPSTQGQATGLQVGTTTISAVFLGQVGTATLNVTSATLTSITVQPSSTSIAPGASQNFTATGHFSDGTVMDITRQVSWDSSNNSVATINSAGGALGVGSGTTTISAAKGNVSGMATLTVQ